MKRFFCTVCQRVKRVRVLPSNTQSVLAKSPNNRVGQCDRHLEPVAVGKTEQMRSFAKKNNIPTIVLKTRKGA